MRGVLEDVQHALRLYRRTPGASLMVIMVLAVGMAFVTAFLSLYSDLILRPEPGFEPGPRIVSVGWNDGRNAGGLPIDLMNRVADDMTTLDALAGTAPQQFRVGEEKEPLIGEMVTRQFFPGLRPKLALGRGFSAEEHNEQAEPVVVISWRYWQERFAGRADVLGEVLRVEGMQDAPVLPPGQPQVDEQPKQFRIVGVMSREFVGTLAPRGDRQTTFWIPVERGIAIALPVTPQFRASLIRSMTMRGVGRRAEGASNQAVLGELSTRFADEEFIRRPGARYEVIDRIVQNIFIHRDTQRQLQLFLAGSVLLALVAAANVSLFLLARAPGRRRELGIRMAVGAPVGRLMRQLASEAAVLVVAAALLGLGLSIWLARYLRELPFLRQAQWRDVTLLDWRVLTLVALFLLLVTLLVSLAPVLGLRKLGIAASSRLVSARPTLAQRIAGTAQVAVAGTLGGAALAFGWFLASTLLSDPGYRTDNLIAVTYSLVTQGRPVSVRVENGRIVATGIVDAERRREAFAAVPGVTSVSLAAAVPGVDAGSSASTVADPADPEQGVRVRYMHSDVETLERIELIRDLRLGVYDVLIGINLLREGLDIPECGLVCILDADKEGFLRSETSLIQTIGRAARNVDGRVILYADRITGSMERAIAETDRRREKQREFNEEHGITPTTIKRNIQDIVAHTASRDGVLVEIDAEDGRNNLVGHNLRAYIEELEKKMRDAAADLEFEEAGRLRDEIRRLEADELGLPDDQKKAPLVGRATEGKPGTRKMRYGKTQRKWGR